MLSIFTVIVELSKTCDYGDHLNDMLRYRFVIELSNGATQQTLLTEADFTFVKAVNIETTREAAIRDIEALHPKSNINSESFSVNYEKYYNNKPNNNKVKSNFDKQSDNSSYRNDQSKYATKPRKNCSGCGQFHWK